MGVCPRSPFTVHLFLVCRKAIDLCKSILYVATLLNLFTISRSVLVEFLGTLMYSIMLSGNGDSVTSFLSYSPLTFLSCLISPGRTQSTILKRSEDSPVSFLPLVGLL